MTLEETVEYFRDMVESCGAYELCPCFHDYMEMTKIALSALEKQVAKKPIPTEEQNIRYVMNYTCPSCGKHCIGTGIANYCYHCGQALDWRETE